MAFVWEHKYLRESELKARYGLSTEYFRKARYQGRLTRPVFVRTSINEGGGSKGVLYHQQLLEDWLANRAAPEVHARAVEAFYRSLPSSIPSKRGPKSERPQKTEV
jgi:hypothetical protein